MIVVLGSGFGIYGHLAALTGLGLRVGTLRRYQNLIDGRAELEPCRSLVEYGDEAELLCQATIIILARRPIDNFQLVKNVLMSKRKVSRVVIEKPIAPSAEQAIWIHREMLAHAVRYHVPYIFRYCDWALDLQKTTVKSGRDIEIFWRMPKKNADECWKYNPLQGGGAFAFYLIHVIAVLVSIFGPMQENSLLLQGSAGVAQRCTLRAVFENNIATTAFAFSVDTPAFRIKVGEKVLLDAESPFGKFPHRGEPDPRIGPLQRFYTAEVLSEMPPMGLSRFHEQVIDAWSRLTAANLFDGMS